MTFYTYLWLREDGTPYYVGKGTGQRAFVNYQRTIFRPVQDERIIVQEHETESEALEAERFLISFYGRIDLGTGCLRNLTDGGEGLSGYLLTAVRAAQKFARNFAFPTWGRHRGIRGYTRGTSLGTKARRCPKSIGKPQG